MEPIIEKSLALMMSMYSEDLGLFSYSTQLVQNQYVNRFDSPRSLRYTINCLLGLKHLQDVEKVDANFESIFERFQKRYGDSVQNPGDRGLFLCLLAQTKSAPSSDLLVLAKDLSTLTENGRSLNLQELSWILMGISECASATGSGEIYNIAKRVWTKMHTSFLNKESLFPLHSPKPFRRRYASFGAITYFLQSTNHYARLMNDQYAQTLFRELVYRVIRLQGPQGEWGWFYDTSKARVTDWYQIYSVHQASMSMLFLLPALNEEIPGVDEAIRKSYRWLFGQNRLSSSMITMTPFFIYRSMQRNSRIEKGLRVAKSLLVTTSLIKANLGNRSGVDINKECRSYEMGWLLYAWAGRKDFPEFTTLKGPDRSTGKA